MIPALIIVALLYLTFTQNKTLPFIFCAANNTLLSDTLHEMWGYADFTCYNLCVDKERLTDQEALTVEPTLARNLARQRRCAMCVTWNPRCATLSASCGVPTRSL